MKDWHAFVCVCARACVRVCAAARRGRGARARSLHASSHGPQSPRALSAQPEMLSAHPARCEGERPRTLGFSRLDAGRVRAGRVHACKRNDAPPRPAGFAALARGEQAGSGARGALRPRELKRPAASAGPGPLAHPRAGTRPTSSHAL